MYMHIISAAVECKRGGVRVYLSEYSGVEELLKLFIAVVDTELLETVCLEVL